MSLTTTHPSVQLKAIIAVLAQKLSDNSDKSCAFCIFIVFSNQTVVANLLLWHLINSKKLFSCEQCKRKWKRLRISFCFSMNKQMKERSGSTNKFNSWREGRKKCLTPVCLVAKLSLCWQKSHHSFYSTAIHVLVSSDSVRYLSLTGQDKLSQTNNIFAAVIQEMGKRKRAQQHTSGQKCNVIYD